MVRNKKSVFHNVDDKRNRIGVINHKVTIFSDNNKRRTFKDSCVVLKEKLTLSFSS